MGTSAKLLWQIDMESVQSADISDWIFHERGENQGRRRNGRSGSIADLRTVVLWHRWLIVAMNAVIDGDPHLSRDLCWKKTDLTMTGLCVRPPDRRERYTSNWEWSVNINELAEALEDLKADTQAYASLRARINHDATLATAMVAERKVQNADKNAEKATKDATRWAEFKGSEWEIKATSKEQRARKTAMAWRRRAEAYREASGAMLAAEISKSPGLTEKHYEMLWRLNVKIASSFTGTRVQPRCADVGVGAAMLRNR